MDSWLLLVMRKNSRLLIMTHWMDGFLVAISDEAEFSVTDHDVASVDFFSVVHFVEQTIQKRSF
jgi:hypothetical protein